MQARSGSWRVEPLEVGLEIDFRRLAALPKSKKILTIDFYHGVRGDEIVNRLIARLPAARVICCETAKRPETELYPMLERNITDDRVLLKAVMTP